MPMHARSWSDLSDYDLLDDAYGVLSEFARRYPAHRTIILEVQRVVLQELEEKREERKTQSKQQSPHETNVYALYKGRRYEATYSDRRPKNQSIRYEGDLYSPSAAANRICGTQVNGLMFWRYLDSDGVEVRLKEHKPGKT